MFQKMIVKTYGDTTKIIDTCFTVDHPLPDNGFAASSYAGGFFLLKVYQSRYLNLANAFFNYYQWLSDDQAADYIRNPLANFRSFQNWNERMCREVDPKTMQQVYLTLTNYYRNV